MYGRHGGRNLRQLVMWCSHLVREQRKMLGLSSLYVFPHSAWNSIFGTMPLIIKGTCPTPINLV